MSYAEYERREEGFAERERYQVTVRCTCDPAGRPSGDWRVFDSDSYLFESEIPKSEDDGSTPMSWVDGQVVDATSPDGLRPPKGYVRPEQHGHGRRKLYCRACNRAPLEIRVEKLGSILDTLARAGINNISLDALAARLRGASAGRRET